MRETEANDAKNVSSVRGGKQKQETNQADALIPWSKARQRRRMFKGERRWIGRYKVVVRRVEKRDSCETKTSDQVIGSQADLSKPSSDLRAPVRGEGYSSSFAR